MPRKKKKNINLAAQDISTTTLQPTTNTNDALSSCISFNKALERFSHAVFKNRMNKKAQALLNKTLQNNDAIINILKKHKIIINIVQESTLIQHKQILIEIEKYLKNLNKLTRLLDSDAVYLINKRLTILINHLVNSKHIDIKTKQNISNQKIQEGVRLHAILGYFSNLSGELVRTFLSTESLSVLQKTKLNKMANQINEIEGNIARLDKLSLEGMPASLKIDVPFLQLIYKTIRGKIAILKNTEQEALQITQSLFAMFQEAKTEPDILFFYPIAAYTMNFINYNVSKAKIWLAEEWLNKLTCLFKKTKHKMAEVARKDLQNEIDKAEKKIKFSKASFADTALMDRDQALGTLFDAIFSERSSVAFNELNNDLNDFLESISIEHASYPSIDKLCESLRNLTKSDVKPARMIFNRALENKNYLAQAKIYSLNILETDDPGVIKTLVPELIIQLSHLFIILDIEKNRIKKMLASEDLNPSKIQNDIKHILSLLENYLKLLKSALPKEEMTALISAIKYWRYELQDIQSIRLNKLLFNYADYFTFVNDKQQYSLIFNNYQIKDIFTKTLLADTSKNKLTFTEGSESARLDNITNIPFTHIQEVLAVFSAHMKDEEKKSSVNAYPNFEHVTANNSVNAKQKQRAAYRRAKKEAKNIKEKLEQTQAAKKEIFSPVFFTTPNVIEPVLSQPWTPKFPIIDEDARFAPQTEDTRRNGFALAKQEIFHAVETPSSSSATIIEKIASLETFESVIDALKEIQRMHQNEFGILGSLLILTKITCNYFVGSNISKKDEVEHNKLCALRRSLVHPDFSSENWLHYPTTLTNFIKNLIGTRDTVSSIKEGLIYAIDATPFVKQLLKIESKVLSEQSQEMNVANTGIFSATKRPKQIILSEHIDIAYISKSLNGCIERMREYGDIFVALLNSDEKCDTGLMKTQILNEQTKHIYAIQYLIICVNECLNSLGFSKNMLHESTLSSMRNIIADEPSDLSTETVRQFLENDLPILERNFIAKDARPRLNT